MLRKRLIHRSRSVPLHMTAASKATLSTTRFFHAATKALLSKTAATQTEAGNTISPMDIEWVAPNIGSSTDTTSGGRSHGSPNTAAGDVVQYDDVIHLDNFAKARVANFVKRHEKSPSNNNPSGTGNTTFCRIEVIRIQSSVETTAAEDEAQQHYHGTILIPFPAEHGGPMMAHGLADTAKDAEILASMHAERLIDAKGFHIYTLPSMQKKHAENAKAVGRWAPSPDDQAEGLTPNQPRSTALPLPLRRVRARDESEGGVWQLLDTKPSTFRGNPYAIVSSAIIEPMSLHRVRSFFLDHGMVIDQYLKLIETPIEPLSNSKFFVATICIPRGLSMCGTDVIASGKAVDRHTATVLAAMHAELVIDALGISLFPKDSKMQDEHTAAVVTFGRWAADAKHCRTTPHNGYPTPLPLPLKQLVVPNGKSRVSLPNAEEELVRRHKALIATTNSFVDVPFAPSNLSVEMLKEYLKRNGDRRASYPFFLDRLGVLYKATVVLHVQGQFGVRGGVGVGRTASEAEALAAEHAIDVLCFLGDQTLRDAQFANFLALRQEQGRIPLASQPPEPTAPSPAGLRCIDAPVRQHNSTSSTTSAEPSAAAPPVLERIDPKQHQATNPSHRWNLEPQWQGKFLLVDKKTEDAHLPHTIASPRVVDRNVKSRIVAYLADNGQRFADVASSTAHTDETGSSFFRCMIILPVPSSFGSRIAVGESNDTVDAENLACMHAELTLDALGIPLYANAAFQRRHADAARKFGRYAPYPGDSPADPTAPSPPALKRLGAALAEWERMKGLRDAKTAPPVPTATAAATSSGEVLDEESKSDASSSPLKALYIRQEDMDPVSKLRVQNYLRRQPGSHEVRMVFDGVHIAKLKIPVPERFGKRIATGRALKKNEAENLCYMHAEHIIDALGLHMFNLPGLQRMHAERVKGLRRWASLPHENLQLSGATPSPPSLAFGEALARPAKPVSPTPDDLKRNPHLWNEYTAACELYLEAIEKIEMNMAFQNELVPRTGNPLLDQALDDVDAEPTVDLAAKQKLTAYCFKSNLSYPTYWKSQTVGPTNRRVCFTTVEVPGFEHLRAMGVASNKETSHRKAAMHIFAILRKIEPDFVLFENEYASNDSLNASQRLSAASKKEKLMGAWDHVAKQFTNDGKIKIIELFTVFFGLSPPTVLNKQRIDGNFVANTTTVELTDEDGKVWTGKAEDAGRRTNLTGAYDDLFQQLLSSAPGFQSLTTLVKSHPHLDPERLVDVRFSDELREKLRHLLDDIDAHRRRHGDATALRSTDGGENEEEEYVANLDGDQSSKDGEGFSNTFSVLDSEEKRYRSQQLKQSLVAKLASPEYQERFAEKRKKLSIHDHKEEILSAVHKNQVVVICGTTGCGKTTQIPQFLLDDATERGFGGEVSMIITQPRRLSAVSIAQRVAAERLESIGSSCGYSIRLDTKPGRHINFVTSGVLLRLFHASPTLEGINYVIIDEIHERDINSDFLLILVRDLIRRRPDLRVILMSATLSSSQFAAYFNGAPVINVEGYVHPVKELFLEDISAIAESKSKLTPLFKECLSSEEKRKAEAAAASASVANRGGWSEPVSSVSSSMAVNVDEPPKTQKYGFLEAVGEVDYSSIQFAVDYVVEQQDLTDSSILVFLPGWEEIVKAKELLERNQKFHIITLHSSVGAAEQMQCFQPAPEGKTKLILSTNIAESGVTIDDIAAVIDVGRAKEKSYILRRGRTSFGRNEMGSMSQLVTVYASRANCVQRRGRVGRTRPGICIRLYTKHHYQSVHDFQTPEMLRQPLDALCLQILALGLGNPVDFLGQAVEPPTSTHIESAMNRLHDLGGVTTKGLLTPLGLHLAKLPVAPRVGKMILVGAVLKCLDSALTIAACSDTDVYVTAREHRDAVRAHREDLSNNTLSDHISSVNGFNFWVSAHYTKGPQEVMYDLQERMLSVPQLLTVSRYKRQFFDILCHHGFLTEVDVEAYRESAMSHKAEIFVDQSSYSVDATDVGIVKTMIASGLFPNISLHRGKKLMRNKFDNRLAPASASVVAKAEEENVTNPFFVYEEIVKQSIDQNVDRLVLRGVSSIPLWSILLMGSPSLAVTYNEELNMVLVDNWLLFRANFNTLELIRRFRKEFNRCLTRKFVAPNDRANNEMLEECRMLFKEIIHLPLKPNEIALTTWEEKGTILKPETSPKPSSEAEQEIGGDEIVVTQDRAPLETGEDE